MLRGQRISDDREACPPAAADGAVAAVPAGAAPGGIEGDDRRTTLGRFLRRSSLDELPQLWNVVRGAGSSMALRAELDNTYIETWSLGLDVRILGATVGAVLRGAE